MQRDETRTAEKRKRQGKRNSHVRLQINNQYAQKGGARIHTESFLKQIEMEIRERERERRNYGIRMYISSLQS